MKRSNRIRIRGLKVHEPRCVEKEHEITIEFLRLVNESTSTRGLIQSVTTFFQRQSGCQAVGVRLKDGDDYPYFEAKGFPREFNLTENSLCDRDEAGNILRDSTGRSIVECMCDNVICGRFDPSKPFFTAHGSFWTNCTTELLARTGEADHQARTRNRCDSRGNESVALIPLRLGGERLGLLQLNDRRKGAFSPKTIGFWEQLADHLAVALAKMRAEEAATQKNYELERLNRTLKALRDCSQAVSCASEEAGFLNAVCRVVVEDCGHEMVWIGYAEEDEQKSVRPVAYAGFEHGYLETLKITWADRDRGCGPTGTAIRKGRPIACRNMLTDPQFAPWREEAVKRGYASSLALPLMDGGKAFGALTIYSRERDPFSIEEVRLLSELTTDLAYGIVTIRLRLAHAQAEELLWKSGERYRSLVELSPNPIFINRDDRIDYVNPAAMELFGATSAEQLLGRSPLELFHPDYHAAARKRIEQLREGQTPPRIEEKILRLDGKERDVEVVGSVFTDQQGPAIQVIIYDITHHKQMEDRLRGAKEAAEAANRAKDHFLANISHELRTPMNAILGMTELALGEELPPAVRDYLETANESADMLLELLNEILDFSRIEAEQFHLESAPFSLRRMLAHTLKSLGVRAYEKGLELFCDVPDHIPDQFVGDSLRLRQVLTNLIGNAIKFTARGEIVVSVTDENLIPNPQGRRFGGDGHLRGDHPFAAASHRPEMGPRSRFLTKDAQENDVMLKFAVEDTGIGIHQDEQERIFAPFTQADTSLTRKYGGTGLGLTIASGLVKLMGGRIEVESQPDKGSTFSFTARLKRPAPTATGMAAILAKRDRLNNLPILLLAENSTFRGILQKMLCRWVTKPEIMSDTPAALARLHKAAADGETFPIAVLDVSLPQTDGYSLAKWIQSNPGLVGTIILMVSPCEGAANVCRCQELGVRYLEKPILPSKLLNSISQALGSAHPAPPIPLAHPRSTGSAVAKRPLRVLIVEDNLANRKLLLRVLDKFGYATEVASNGLDAVEKVRGTDFDVVLMDIQMPVMDGYQATTAIRALPDHAKAGVPIVALTAHARKGDEQHCLSAGMDAYLNKPIGVRKLIAVLERIIIRQGESSICGSESALVESEPEVISPSSIADRVFDLQEALNRCFDHEMFEQMREYFFTQSAEILEQIRDAFARFAGEEIARAAHALKGTVVYLGSRSCLEAVENLEHVSRSGDLTSADKSIECLAAQIELLRNALISIGERQRTSRLPRER